MDIGSRLILFQVGLLPLLNLLLLSSLCIWLWSLVALTGLIVKFHVFSLLRRIEVRFLSLLLTKVSHWLRSLNRCTLWSLWLQFPWSLDYLKAYFGVYWKLACGERWEYFDGWFAGEGDPIWPVCPLMFFLTWSIFCSILVIYGLLKFYPYIDVKSYSSINERVDHTFLCLFIRNVCNSWKSICK